MGKFTGLFKKTSYTPIERVEEPKMTVQTEQESEPSVPEGLWVKCSKCNELIYKDDVRSNAYVCPKCQGYFRIKTKTRLRMVVDRGSFVPWGEDIQDKNPLDFPGYEEKLEQVRAKSHLKEAVTVGKCKIEGREAVVGVCDARFLMSSMGYVVGEKITAAIERATREKLPVIMFCCSGGARMQEGIVSLMQMAKTSAAIKKHSDAGQFYMTVLTDPTTGGVTASFAMLGDVILAEPGALIGFAGPRVIAQTTGEKLPEGFQRAEFLVEKGIIDGTVERRNLKSTLAYLLKVHSPESGELLESDMDQEKIQSPDYKKSRKVVSAWDRVQIARSAERPTGMQYIEGIFTDFMELHGDRGFRDDGAVIGGLALLDGQPVTVIAQQKGKNIKENVTRNFGMVSPEGYRKALRLMKQAEKFNRPIINFVDTPGAACGIGAEERGQGEAIARNIMEMSGLKVPVLSIVIGEGGSGGALALAVANEVWMMENATYSILSPEGFASILWKDGKRGKEASEVMKMTASDLKELGVIEQIIPEDEPASDKNMGNITIYMKKMMKLFLKKMEQKSGEELAEDRYQRFRRM